MEENKDVRLDEAKTEEVEVKDEALETKETEETVIEDNKSSDSKKEPIIQLKNVDITFGKFKAVNNATFDIYKGETFSLVGESGSGKTTIGRAIIRINEVSNGEILYNGKRISGKISRKEDRDVVRNIQMIFQDPAASLNERATVEYIVSEGLYNFKLCNCTILHSILDSHILSKQMGVHILSCHYLKKC